MNLRFWRAKHVTGLQCRVATRYNVLPLATSLFACSGYLQAKPLSEALQASANTMKAPARHIKLPM